MAHSYGPQTGPHCNLNPVFKLIEYIGKECSNTWLFLNINLSGGPLTRTIILRLAKHFSIRSERLFHLRVAY